MGGVELPKICDKGSIKNLNFFSVILNKKEANYGKYQKY